MENALFDFFKQVFWGVFGFFSPAELFSWVNLIIPFALAVVVLHRQRGRFDGSLSKDLFPVAIWKNPSSLLDVKIFMLIQGLKYIIIVPPIAYLFTEFSSFLLDVLNTTFEPMHNKTVEADNAWWETLLYSLIVFICIDFGFFISHYWSHKSKYLWCFHKVHHSAPVLNPFTAFRFHPLDYVWNFAFSTCFVALAGALCRYTFYHGEMGFFLLGNNMIIGLAFLTTHNLRHSHIWLDYPKGFRWLISPVQHQMHHSCEARHIDKNFGYLLACWDRWFGTLYIPQGKESFQLGVKNMPEQGIFSHRTVYSTLVAPFIELRACLRKPPPDSQAGDLS